MTCRKFRPSDWQNRLHAALAGATPPVDVWRLAQAAPARWSRPLLLKLAELEWRPPDVSPDFEALVQHAAACSDAPPVLGGRYRHCTILKGHQKNIASAAITPDHRLLITGSDDHTIRLWDLTDLRPRGKLTGHTHGVDMVVVHPDGTRCASGSFDRTIRLWRLPDGEPLNVLKHPKGVKSLTLTPDGDQLIAGGWDHHIYIWDWEGRQLQTLRGHAGTVYSVAVSLNGQWLASGDNTGLVLLWRLADGEQVAQLQSHTCYVTQLRFSANSYYLLSGDDRYSIVLWRIPDGQRVKHLPGQVGNWTLTPDERWLVSQAGSTFEDCKADSVWVWRLPELTRHKQLWDGWAGKLAISPDSQYCAVASGYRNAPHIRLYSLPEGAALARVRTSSNFYTTDRLLFAPDGRLISYGYDGKLRFWESKTHSLCRLPPEKLTPGDLAWARKMVAQADITPEERGWLEFLLARERREDSPIGPA